NDLPRSDRRRGFAPRPRPPRVALQRQGLSRPHGAAGGGGGRGWPRRGGLFAPGGGAPLGPRSAQERGACVGSGEVREKRRAGCGGGAAGGDGLQRRLRWPRRQRLPRGRVAQDSPEGAGGTGGSGSEWSVGPASRRVESEW